MVVANIAFILMHPSGTENRNKLAASDVKAETSTSTPAARHQKPLEVCEKLAPKAAATYTSKAADRDRLIKRYFASDAQGLNIPIDRIAARRTGIRRHERRHLHDRDVQRLDRP